MENEILEGTQEAGVALVSEDTKALMTAWTPPHRRNAG